MIQLAEIFRCHGPAYRQKFGGHIPASHLKAMAAIEQCRTEALGGHVYICEACHQTRYSYHSCKPPLPQVPKRRWSAIANPATSLAPAGTLLHGHLHSARGATSRGPPSPTGGV